jgi:elongation factor Ts
VAEFTAKDVQALRKATGAGMLDAKRALEHAGGDMEEAARWLRLEGLSGAASRATREAVEGAVAIASTPTAVAAAALRCETDFVAKSEEFVEAVEELARLVAERGEAARQAFAPKLEELAQRVKERVEVGELVRFAREPGSLIATYLHRQAGRGVNAVLVELEGGDESLGHEVAMHIAFARPAYLRPEDVPPAEVEAERALLEEITRKEGKPEAQQARIVEGRLQGWFKERCLLEQPFVRDEKRRVRDVLGQATVRRFAQVVIGT